MLLVIHEGYCKSNVECGDNVFINHFYVPGDIIALDAVKGGKYPITIKAATAAEVCHINITRSFKVANKGPLVATTAIKSFCKGDGLIVKKLRYYANKHVEARIAAFLVELYKMHLRIDRPETALRLPLSRDEIASYLDLKTETISRSLKSFEQ